ncbi:mitogen-activated protein kinase kinase kinase 2 [Phalaenopsis equestris]|uniref:mitogen-activated protein kinase kinase kinase 2 n=1 Tax=Phalaenopsis equestris TaxID=78828 RepID=UPI0009E58CA9|nr:mitogen-activated protein kinase kinase kinase 2 [Phalaenopsis equestris]
MSGQVPISESSDSFEYMLFEGDPDHLKPVILKPNKISAWINPDMLKLGHRIGRGPFGDVWLATHHHSFEDYDRCHEVAVKMLYPVKDDYIQVLISKFENIFSKCQGLKNVCLLHGISILNGRVCIVMKFCEGSIGDKIALAKDGKLSLPDVLRYGIELAEGISQLHSKEILVLNLKPCNFLLDGDDHAVLGEFGIPFLLIGFSLSSSDLVQRPGMSHYMAPEQWQPSIRGPISFETDSWGFGCSIVEMLTGYQPWHGKSADEIYNLAVKKQVKPNIPTGLPPEMENVLHGCFEYDFRNRPLMTDVLDVFKSIRDGYKDVVWSDSAKILSNKSYHSSYTDWSLLKDILQVGDTVRSRKPKDSCQQTNMAISEGTVVGLETKDDTNGFILVRVHRFHNPLRVHSSMVERVSHGFAAGDWVRISNEEDMKHSPIGILHKIDHNGRVTVAFAGLETLWEGNHTELQMAASYCIGQFIRIKSNVSNPMFDWPKNKGGIWATGRIMQILPNGCLVVRFPGRLSFGDAPNYLADPSEVEAVSFTSCYGVVKKYQHLEDYHWSVRPLVVALGLFAALKLGVIVRNGMVKKEVKALHGESPKRQQEKKVQHVQNGSSSAWFPSSVANVLFGEPVAPSR